MRANLKRVIFLSMALLLSACQSLDTPTNEHALWTMKAKLNVRGDESYSATIFWRQFENSFSANVQGPFGIGATTLWGDEQLIYIQSTEGELSGNPSTLLATQLGWNFPIHALPYWVRGKSAPAIESSIEVKQNATIIKQLGWEIRLSRFMLLEGQNLPQRIDVSRSNQRVIFIVSNWS